MGGTNLLQDFGVDFLGSGAWSRLTPAPFFEPDIKWGSEDTLEDVCDSEYGEDGDRERPAHRVEGSVRSGLCGTSRRKNTHSTRVYIHI